MRIGGSQDIQPCNIVEATVLRDEPIYDNILFVLRSEQVKGIVWGLADFLSRQSAASIDMLYGSVDCVLAGHFAPSFPALRASRREVLAASTVQLRDDESITASR